MMTVIPCPKKTGICIKIVRDNYLVPTSAEKDWVLFSGCGAENWAERKMTKEEYRSNNH